MSVMRWPGKPTSGRYVYRCAGGWYWQCDLHDDDDEEGVGAEVVSLSMQAAFTEALAHAMVCAESNR